MVKLPDSSDTCLGDLSRKYAEHSQCSSCDMLGLPVILKLALLYIANTLTKLAMQRHKLRLFDILNVYSTTFKRAAWKIF